jgi:hypothetical protein
MTRRRVETLTGDENAAEAVVDIYEARSGIVHLGKPPSESLEISTAQRAYLHCLEAMAVQLGSVTARDHDRSAGSPGIQSQRVKNDRFRISWPTGND